MSKPDLSKIDFKAIELRVLASSCGATLAKGLRQDAKFFDVYHGRERHLRKAITFLSRYGRTVTGRKLRDPEFQNPF